VGAGAGYNQIVAMANWWAKASAPSGQMVQQFRLISYAPDVVPAGAVVLRSDGVQSLVLEAAPTVEATGELAAALVSDADGRVDVTGHSLGGHLAMAFSSLFASHTGQVTVFNAPGFSNSTVNQDFFIKLGGSIPTGSTSAGPINNVAADEALVGDSPFNFVAGMHSRLGVQVDIAIEKQTNSDEPNPLLPALNHSIVTLTDSLAVYKLLADLAPASGENAFTTTDYKRILNQAVQGTAAGYERMIDALNKLFRPAAAVPALQ
jgi:pimeloyl-ACP methyl ester carboxylesterase